MPSFNKKTAQTALWSNFVQLFRRSRDPTATTIDQFYNNPANDKEGSW
jgi:hypothetical protein